MNLPGKCPICLTDLPLVGKRGHGQTRKYCSDKCRWQAWNRAHPRMKTAQVIESGRST